jgi:DNA-binding NarL/FixJ family response regulator
MRNEAFAHGTSSPTQGGVSTVDRRVVVAEDHPLMLKAIVQILDEANGFEVVGSATTGAQVAPLVARTNPDLVLLDLQLPILDGLSCLASLREHHPRVTVVVFSGSDGQEEIERALRGGAAAFVAKSIDPFDIPAVLRQALDGNVYYTTPRVSRETVAEAQHERDDEGVRSRTGLTPRELEILASVSRGLSNRAVGKELFLSDQTVKFHLHRIYGKLGVANRTGAAGMAHKLGLVRDLAYAS